MSELTSKLETQEDAIKRNINFTSSDVQVHTVSVTEFSVGNLT